MGPVIFPTFVSTYEYHTVGIIPEIQRSKMGSLTITVFRTFIQTFKTLCSRS